MKWAALRATSVYKWNFSLMRHRNNGFTIQRAYTSFNVPIRTFFVYFSQPSSITYVSQTHATSLSLSFPFSRFHSLLEFICKHCPINADGCGGSNHYGTLALASPFAMLLKIQFVVHYSVYVLIHMSFGKRSGRY